MEFVRGVITLSAGLSAQAIKAANVFTTVCVMTRLKEISDIFSSNLRVSSTSMATLTEIRRNNNRHWKTAYSHIPPPSFHVLQLQAFASRKKSMFLQKRLSTRSIEFGDHTPFRIHHCSHCIDSPPISKRCYYSTMRGVYQEAQQAATIHFINVPKAEESIRAMIDGKKTRQHGTTKGLFKNNLLEDAAGFAQLEHVCFHAKLFLCFNFFA